jgi:small subunit ribosomal protein S2
VLFVGTKKQAQEAVREQATRVNMPYVTERWLGGMLTNFQTVNKRLQRLKELEEIDFDDVAGSGLTKKELLMRKREKDKLEKTLGGVRTMARVPSAVWIVDTKKEHLAVNEARKLGIPVIAILDTNCDPDEVDFPIPGNDDAIRAVTLLTRVVADAVADGLMAREGQRTGDEAVVGAELGADEPLAEWEKELLAGSPQASAAVDAATAAEPAAAPAAEDSAPDVPAAEAPVAEAPAAEAPAAEPSVEPAADEAAEAPAAEAPAAEPSVEPAADEAAEAPVAEAPAAEPSVEPAADEAAEAPVAEAAAADSDNAEAEQA